MFKQPLSKAELRDLARDVSVAGLFSWKSPTAKAMKLEPGKLSDEQLLDLMEKNPTLIRRPIIVKDGKMQLGYTKQGLTI